MENNENKGFSIWYILGHLFMVSILSSVAIYYIYKGGNASTSDYISGAGSVASVYAILLALWQIKQTRSAAQAAAMAAFMKSKEIDKFLSFANINRHIEISNSIPPFLAINQYEAAVIKIDQLKELLTELKVSKDLSLDDRKTAINYVFRLGTDISSIRQQMSGYNRLDKDIVITHVTDVNTFLQEILAKQKKKEL